MNYHNTTNESGATLTRNINKAKSQNKIVFDYFKAHPYGLFSAEHVYNVVLGNKIPITSARRALSDLVKTGDIIRTEYKKMGIYGRSIFLYRLAENQTLF